MSRRGDTPVPQSISGGVAKDSGSNIEDSSGSLCRSIVAALYERRSLCRRIVAALYERRSQRQALEHPLRLFPQGKSSHSPPLQGCACGIVAALYERRSQGQALQHPLRPFPQGTGSHRPPLQGCACWIAAEYPLHSHTGGPPVLPLRRTQLLVRAIAQRRSAGLLAQAPPHGGFLRGLEFHRLQAGAFVRAIAKRLLGSAAASTPPIGSGFDFEGKRFGITDDWFFRHAPILNPSGQRAIGKSEILRPRHQPHSAREATSPRA